MNVRVHIRRQTRSDAWCALLAFIAACSHPPPAPSAEPCDSTTVDVVHHAVELDVRLAPAVLMGSGEIRVRTRRATRTVSLDTQGVRVSRATLRGQSLRFVHDHERVCIELPQPSAAGQQLTLTLAWTIDPAAKGLHVSDVHERGVDAALSLSDPRAPQRPAPSEAELQPRGVTYARGALVLDKLRAELGDDAFWRGLQQYVKARAETGARSEDLRASFAAVSGRDLNAFFQRWVYAPAPDL